MNKFWFVMCDMMTLQQEQSSFYLPKYRHDSHQSAKTEAERLAKAHEGKRFFVLELIGACEVKNTSWLDISQPTPPF